MSPREAAKELGITELSLKELMKQNRLPIGFYVRKEGASKGRFHIIPEQFEAYKRQRAGGLSDEDVEKIARKLAEYLKQ